MKFKKLLLVLLAIVISTMSLSTVFATDVEEEMPGETEMSILISQNEADGKYYDNDLFVMDESVKVEDCSVDGNVFLMGKTVTVKNVSVTGSLFIMAEDSEISEVLSGGSLYWLGRNLKLDDDSFQNAYALGEDQIVNSSNGFNKNFYGMARSLFFGGNCDRAYIGGENLEIGAEANINELELAAQEEIEFPETAKIGKYNFIKLKTDEEVETVSKTNRIKDGFYSILSYVLISLVIGFIIVKVCPKFLDKMKSAGVEGMLKSMAGGLLVSVLTPILFIVLFISGIMCGIGFRLAFILLLLFIVALLVATPIGLVYIAKLITEKIEKTDTKYLFIVLVILAVVVGIIKEFTPISGVVEIVLGFIGLGSVLFVGMKKEKELE